MRYVLKGFISLSSLFVFDAVFATSANQICAIISSEFPSQVGFCQQDRKMGDIYYFNSFTNKQMKPCSYDASTQLFNLSPRVPNAYCYISNPELSSFQTCAVISSEFPSHVGICQQDAKMGDIYYFNSFKNNQMQPCSYDASTQLFNLFPRVPNAYCYTGFVGN